MKEKEDDEDVRAVLYSETVHPAHQSLLEWSIFVLSGLEAFDTATPQQTKDASDTLFLYIFDSLQGDTSECLDEDIYPEHHMDISDRVYKHSLKLAQLPSDVLTSAVLADRCNQYLQYSHDLLRAASASVSPRTDIHQFVCNQFTLKILLLCSFRWSLAVSTISPSSILMLIACLQNHNHQLLSFGLRHASLCMSIESLCTSFCNRVIENIRLPLSRILKSDAKEHVWIKQDEESYWLYTEAPLDLFRLLMTHIELIKSTRCLCLFNIFFVWVCRRVLRTYQKFLEHQLIYQRLWPQKSRLSLTYTAFLKLRELGHVDASSASDYPLVNNASLFGRRGVLRPQNVLLKDSRIVDASLPNCILQSSAVDTAISTHTKEEPKGNREKKDSRDTPGSPNGIMFLGGFYYLENASETKRVSSVEVSYALEDLNNQMVLHLYEEDYVCAQLNNIALYIRNCMEVMSYLESIESSASAHQSFAWKDTAKAAFQPHNSRDIRSKQSSTNASSTYNLEEEMKHFARIGQSLRDIFVKRLTFPIKSKLDEAASVFQVDMEELLLPMTSLTMGYLRCLSSRLLPLGFKAVTSFVLQAVVDAFLHTLINGDYGRILEGGLFCESLAIKIKEAEETFHAHFQPFLSVEQIAQHLKVLLHIREFLLAQSSEELMLVIFYLMHSEQHAHIYTYSFLRQLLELRKDLSKESKFRILEALKDTSRQAENTKLSKRLHGAVPSHNTHLHSEVKSDSEPFSPDDNRESSTSKSMDELNSVLSDRESISNHSNTLEPMPFEFEDLDKPLLGGFDTDHNQEVLSNIDINEMEAGMEKATEANHLPLNPLFMTMRDSLNNSVSYLTYFAKNSSPSLFSNLLPFNNANKAASAFFDSKGQNEAETEGKGEKEVALLAGEAAAAAFDDTTASAEDAGYRFTAASAARDNKSCVNQSLDNMVTQGASKEEDGLNRQPISNSSGSFVSSFKEHKEVTKQHSSMEETVPAGLSEAVLGNKIVTATVLEDQRSSLQELCIGLKTRSTLKPRNTLEGYLWKESRLPVGSYGVLYVDYVDASFHSLSNPTMASLQLNWKKYWFRLSNGYLYYYLAGEDNVWVLQGYIPIVCIEKVVQKEDYERENNERHAFVHNNGSLNKSLFCLEMISQALGVVSPHLLSDTYPSASWRARQHRADQRPIQEATPSSAFSAMAREIDGHAQSVVLFKGNDVTMGQMEQEMTFYLIFREYLNFPPCQLVCISKSQCKEWIKEISEQIEEFVAIKHHSASSLYSEKEHGRHAVPEQFLSPYYIPYVFFYDWFEVRTRHLTENAKEAQEGEAVLHFQGSTAETSTKSIAAKSRLSSCPFYPLKWLRSLFTAPFATIFASLATHTYAFLFPHNTLILNKGCLDGGNASPDSYAGYHSYPHTHEDVLRLHSDSLVNHYFEEEVGCWVQREEARRYGALLQERYALDAKVLVNRSNHSNLLNNRNRIGSKNFIMSSSECHLNYLNISEHMRHVFVHSAFGMQM